MITKRDIKLNQDNYLTNNLINPSDVKRKKINGKYVYEKFYLIDFLDIKENSYIISSFGRVFSLILRKELKCSMDISSNNYKSTTLKCNDGRECKFAIHRLVAYAFIPKTTTDKKLNRYYIHHKNYDNEYNYYWNLEWVSRFELDAINKINNDIEDEEDLIKVVRHLLEYGETVSDTFRIINGKLSKIMITKIKNNL